MATFIAEDPVHCVVRSSRDVFSPATGEKMYTEKRLFAKFSRASAPTWARKIGAEMYEFRKMPIGLDREITPEEWVACFDSIEAQRQFGWTDAERELVEETLRSGKFAHSGVTEVQPPRIERPWPEIEKQRPHGRRTQQMAAEKLIEIADMIGVSLEHVHDYVLQEGWGEEVVATLKARLEEAPTADEPLVEA